MSDHPHVQDGSVAPTVSDTSGSAAGGGAGDSIDYGAGVELNDTTSQGLAVAMIGSAQSVLEVGAADGVVTAALLANGCTVTAIEPDDTAFETLSRTGAEALHGTFEALAAEGSLDGRTFDVVLCGDVLEHVVDPVATLRALLGYLGTDGRVIISLPNVAHIDVRLALLRGDFPYSDRGLLDRTHLHFFTRALVERLLDECGLVPVDMQRTYAPPFCSELGLSPADFDPALVDELRSDDESETYQFVISAVPLGAASEMRQALAEHAQLQFELHRARREIVRGEERRAIIENQLAEIAQLSASRDALAARVAALETRLQAFERLNRLTSGGLVRRVRGLVRGRGGRDA